MKKVRLSIVKTGLEYRAVIQIGENLCLDNKRVIYQSSREIENRLVDVRAICEKLKEEAKEWAREQKIPYVVNIDLDSYENILQK